MSLLEMCSFDVSICLVF